MSDAKRANEPDDEHLENRENNTAKPDQPDREPTFDPAYQAEYDAAIAEREARAKADREEREARAAEAANPSGRNAPRKYDPEAIFPGILERLSRGESLLQIERDEGMPSIQRMIEWARSDRWAEAYARARELGYTVEGERLLDIADNSQNDWVDREVASGRVERVLDREHMERTKLRIDTRKWILAKMLPRVYGDRVQLEGRLEVLAAFVDMAAKPRVIEADSEAMPHVAPPDGADGQDEPA